MSDSSEEQEASTENQQIIEKLRKGFHTSELLRLTHEVEPAMIFFSVPMQEEVE